MARLIDADMADVVIIYDNNNELTPVSEVREYIKRQKAFLDKFPTIDAVPLVRCRDCKHWDSETWFCDIHSAFWHHDLEWNMFSEDDY